MLKSTLPAPTALGTSGAIVSTYRISVKPSARSSSSAMNCGAVHSAGVLARVTLVVSGAPSWANARGVPTRPAAAAPAAVARKRRRVCSIITASLSSDSRLQLPLQLVQKAPIRALGNDLLRARLDDPDLMQAQRVEPQCVLVIVFEPFVVGHLVQCLQRVIIPRGEAAIDESSCSPRRLGHAEI